MFDDWTTSGSKCHGDDIELHFVWQVVCLHIGVCGAAQICYFLWCHGIEGVKIAGCACFYFNKHKSVAVHGHNVELIVADVGVAVDNGIALAHKIVVSELLSFGSFDVVKCHNAFIPNFTTQNYYFLFVLAILLSIFVGAMKRIECMGTVRSVNGGKATVELHDAATECGGCAAAAICSSKENRVVEAVCGEPVEPGSKVRLVANGDARWNAVLVLLIYPLLVAFIAVGLALVLKWPDWAVCVAAIAVPLIYFPLLKDMRSVDKDIIWIICR